MKRSLKVVLGIFAFIFMAIPFMNVNATSVPTIELTPKGDFFIGESQTFDITTTKPVDYGNVNVIGVGSISDENALEKLEYFEVNDGKWYDLDKQFGMSTGFPLSNMKATFRATFNKAGTYVVNFEIQDASTKEVIAKNSMNIEVKDKSVANVSNEAELLAALANTDVTQINLLNDITTTAKVNVMKNVTVNGNGHKISLQGIDKNVWGGHYVLQAYEDMKLKDIVLTGGNAGLLVNSSKVVLEGTVNVSDNGFGGIELGKGKATNPSLDAKNATIVNSTEEYKKPTLWVDPKSDGITVDYAGFKAVIDTEEQNQYYLVKTNSLPKADEQIKNSTGDVIEVVTTPDDSISKEVLNSLKNGDEKTVNIKVGDVVISFNTKNMTEEFTNDLKLNVIVSKDKTFESNVLKDVKSNLLFVDLDYSGVLAKDTKITFNASSSYNVGDKVYVYYYNSTTDKLELVAKDVVIGENGLTSIEIDHASTYLLSDKELTSDGTVTNPNTSDMNILIIAVLAVVGLGGLAFVAKQKLVSNK